MRSEIEDVGMKFSIVVFDVITYDIVVASKIENI